MASCRRTIQALLTRARRFIVGARESESNGFSPCYCPHAKPNMPVKMVPNSCRTIRVLPSTRTTLIVLACLYYLLLTIVHTLVCGHTSRPKPKGMNGKNTHACVNLIPARAYASVHPSHHAAQLKSIWPLYYLSLTIVHTLHADTPPVQSARTVVIRFIVEHPATSSSRLTSSRLRIPRGIGTYA